MVGCVPLQFLNAHFHDTQNAKNLKAFLVHLFSDGSVLFVEKEKEK